MIITSSSTWRARKTSSSAGMAFPVSTRPPMSFFLDSRHVLSGLLVAASWLLTAGATSAAHPSGTAAASLDEDHAEKMARGLEIFKQQVRPVLVERCLRCHGGK